MRVRLLLTSLLLLTSSLPQPTKASDFDRLYELHSQELEQANLRNKLTALRDKGGWSITGSMACSSWDNYAKLVDTSAMFKPKTSECWQQDGIRVKATERCTGVISGYTETTDPATLITREDAKILLVCEFSSGWFTSNFWMSVEDVRP